MEIFLFIIAAGVIAHLIGASVHEGIFVGALVCPALPPDDPLQSINITSERHLNSLQGTCSLASILACCKEPTLS